MLINTNIYLSYRLQLASLKLKEIFIIISTMMIWMVSMVTIAILVLKARIIAITKIKGFDQSDSNIFRLCCRI